MFMDGKTQLHAGILFPNCSGLPKIICKLNVIPIKITMELCV